MFEICGGMSTLPDTTPSRLRHASAPHSLPSYYQPQTAALRPFCFEAEDVYDHRCRQQRLAGWEERVLRAREERQWRRDKKIALVSAAAMKECGGGQETERTAMSTVGNGISEG